MDRIALCIPAYNAATHLPQLLQSAIEQPIPFDEIWVYDDCSTDNTKQVAEAYGAKVVSGLVNQGCSFGKNTLAGITNCDWIHFHDADDDLLPEFTSAMHEWIAKAGHIYQVLLLNFKYVDHQSGELISTADHNADQLHADAVKYAIENKIVNFGLYKKNSFLAAGGFDLDKNVLYNEDNACHQRLAKARLKFDYLPQVTCINYLYPNSMSLSNAQKCAMANYHVLEKTAATHGKLYPKEISHKLWDCAASLASHQEWGYVKKALQLSKSLGYRHSVNGSFFFNALTFMGPFNAVWFREKMIRLFKAGLRK